MGWYVELHCDNAECPTGSRDEGPQGRSVKEVSAEARRLGWNQLDGRWLCRGCIKERTGL